MPLTNPQLWQRLSEFPLDDPAAELPFSLRLAREKGWSWRQAQRAIEEYRRFVYLTSVAAEPVCPSEEVDAVWHLHLCYTRSYWNGLCAGVLGRKLHHDPTAGGPDQSAYHRRIYEATLAAYRAEFDAEPPERIWPPVERRFDPRHRAREVDAARYWIVRKPPVGAIARVIRRRAASWLAVGAVVCLPPLGAAWNPLDMRGPEFLGFYAGLLACVSLLAFGVRLLLRGGDDAAHLPELDPYEAAVLANGEAGATRIAVAELALAGAIEHVPGEGHELRTIKAEPPELHPLVRAVYRGIFEREEATLSQALAAGAPEAAKIGARLEDLQLVPTWSEQLAARAVPLLMVTGVLALGVAKIHVGLSRDKPVLLLVLLCVLTLGIGGALLLPVRQTRRGARVLAQLRTKHRGLDLASRFEKATTEQQTYALGLFGLSTLAASSLVGAEITQWLAPPRNSGGSGSGCSSRCSSGCGGGGCGGGGCGGCS